MPQPSLGDHRDVLQAIWDVASQTSYWPMYAELARRWYYTHDTDVTDVLRGVGREFVVGVNREVSKPQWAGAVFGLTVAGAAACEGTEEILSLYLDLIQRAAAGAGRITDSEFAQQSQLATGRSESVRLLYLLLRSEPVLWRTNSHNLEPEHWTVWFDHEVQVYKNIQSLDDYWAHSPKYNDPLKPVVAEEYKAQLITDPKVLADVMLEWVYDESDGRAVSISSQFFPAIDAPMINDAVTRLESQNRLQLPCSDGPRNPFTRPRELMLTEEGVAHVESNRRNWNDRKFRDRAARNMLLTWLYNETLRGDTGIDYFLYSPQSIVEGQRFSAADVHSAFAYLLDKELIDQGLQSDRNRVERLTAKGYELVEEGGDVTEHFKRSEGGITYNIAGDVSGSNFARDNATQVAVTNVDVDSLRTLMQAITEAMPGLGLGTQERQDAQDAVAKIVSETQQDRPDPSRLRKIMRHLRGTLASSAQQALVAVLVGTIDYELTKMGLPVDRAP
jgi:hypothetical protein